MKNEESFEQSFLGSRGGDCSHREGDRTQYPVQRRPSRLRATLCGRSLAPWRPQPGCELGLRRTLLAARRRYSLCLSAGAVATGVTCALSVSLEPKYCLPVPLQRHKEWFRSSFPRALGSWKTQKGERVRHTQRERE